MNNFATALLAVLLGNLLYFLLLPHLPSRLRHSPFRMDWGLGVDFIFCGMIYLGMKRLADFLAISKE